ncbi:MAG: hypothetical protein KF843_16410 [Flavobacteriales bacterium]|nr:hypothetical protein [Flavobacteriales bacterium]
MKSLIRSLRPSRSWSFLAVILFATGCITIEEHYTFKKNGSGTMEYVVDMSSMLGLKDVFDKSGDRGKERKKDKGTNDGPMTTGFDERAKQLKGLEGIKRVKQKNKKDGFVQSLSFAFADVDALNRALNVLMPDSTGVQQTFFHWEGNTLVRTNNQYAKELGGDMAGDPDSNDQSDILESMKYTYSFKFAEKVKEVKRAEGVTQESPSAKKLELATDWAVIMKDPEALDLRITLDK